MRTYLSAGGVFILALLFMSIAGAYMPTRGLGAIWLISRHLVMVAMSAAQSGIRSQQHSGPAKTTRALCVRIERDTDDHRLIREYQSSGFAYGSSQFSTSGLFFAGHQNTGEIFVFDLDRTNGLLYAWHGASINKLQLFGPDDCCGRFMSIALYDNPFCCNWNIEGLALVGNDGCASTGRSLLFTRDQS